MKFAYLLFILFAMLNTNQVFAQLEFMQEDRLLFVGADSIENKRIIASVEIIPKDSLRLELRIDILHDWKVKESILDSVTLDPNSVDSEIVTLVYHSDTTSAYRFFNVNGLEILIANEQFFKISEESKAKGVKPYNMTIARVFLPKDEKHYVMELPLMHYK